MHSLPVPKDETNMSFLYKPTVSRLRIRAEEARRIPAISQANSHFVSLLEEDLVFNFLSSFSKANGLDKRHVVKGEVT